jgi:oligoendopeptidase F
MSVATLAHELGHSFHAYCNFDQRFWRQSAPSTLCETASILCEHFLRDTLANDESRPPMARLSALCSQVDAAVNYLIRIPRDFDFELEFLRSRAAGDVTAEQLCERMQFHHRRWFGDGLTDDGDRYGWTYSHFLTDSTLRLYNFPYSFGYMLSRYIADRFFEEGPTFLPTYVSFLRAAGTTTTEAAVLETLGVDVRSAAFWRSGLERIAKQVDAVEALSASLGAA